MNSSPLFNFIVGGIFGSLVAIAATLHIVTNQVEARNGAITKSIDALGQHDQKTVKTMQQIVDTWQARAEKCEVKERAITVIYEYRPSTAIPILHGAFALTLGSEKNHPGSDLKPIWVIPVQTEVFTNIRGAGYEWLDGKTGASIGIFPATPPPSGQQ